MTHQLKSTLSLVATVALLSFSGLASLTPVAQAAAEVGSKSTLITDAKKTEGSIQIIEEAGKRYLELDESFTTGRGPDVFVLLHTQDVPEDYSKENFVNLGRVQKFNGAQRYEIPADVDLANFKSVSIWCRAFNVTFGYGSF